MRSLQYYSRYCHRAAIRKYVYLFTGKNAIHNRKMNGCNFCDLSNWKYDNPWLVGQLVAAFEYSYFMKTITLSFSVGLILFFLIQNIFQNISRPGYRDGKK
jgi:uncharacterized protein YukJ